MQTQRTDKRRLGVRLVALSTLAAALAAGALVAGARSASRSSGLIAFARSDGIYVMHPDGSHVRAIRRGGVARYTNALAWSPDGRKLAFVSGGRSIWVINADGTDPVRVVPSGESSFVSIQSMAWSPDGGRLAFTAARANETVDNDIWTVNADGSNSQRAARTPDLFEIDVDWSHAGDRFAFTDGQHWILNLYAMNTDGSGMHMLSPSPGHNDAMPDWSPNGRRIAFMRTFIWEARALGASIWVTDPDGRNQVRLTRQVLYDADPTWSPDGRKIAFVRVRTTESEHWNPYAPVPKRSTAELVVMNADGTHVTKLTHNRMGEAFPAWQPVAAP